MSSFRIEDLNGNYINPVVMSVMPNTGADSGVIFNFKNSGSDNYLHGFMEFEYLSEDLLFFGTMNEQSTQENWAYIHRENNNNFIFGTSPDKLVLYIYSWFVSAGNAFPSRFDKMEHIESEVLEVLYATFVSN